MDTTQKSNPSFTPVKQQTIRLPSIRLADKVNVQPGGQGPAFRKALDRGRRQRPARRAGADLSLSLVDPKIDWITQGL